MCWLQWEQGHHGTPSGHWLLCFPETFRDPREVAACMSLQCCDMLNCNDIHKENKQRRRFSPAFLLVVFLAVWTWTQRILQASICLAFAISAFRYMALLLHFLRRNQENKSRAAGPADQAWCITIYSGIAVLVLQQLSGLLSSPFSEYSAMFVSSSLLSTTMSLDPSPWSCRGGALDSVSPWYLVISWGSPNLQNLSDHGVQTDEIMPQKNVGLPLH